MSAPVQLILFLYHFSLGLVVPVLNLVLLNRGANLETLPLLYLVMAVTVMSLELPSGILADLLGRRKIFLLSCILNVLAFSLLIIIRSSLAGLMLVVIVYGIGRAFASGSIDALIIDQSVARNGHGFLPQVTARLAMIEGVALSLGSITGGLLAQAGHALDSHYTLSLVCRTILILLVIVLGYRWIPADPRSGHPIPSLPLHLRQGSRLIRTNTRLGFLILGGIFSGLFLSSVETYWQPSFLQLNSQPGSEWLFGLITFSGFMAVSIGNVLAQKLLERFKFQQLGVYLLSRLVLSGALAVFAMQKSRPGFIGGYTAVYLFLGVSNISESTLIQQMTPSYMRASILSLSSLLIQIGLMGAAVFSSLAISTLHISGLWLVMAGLMGGYTWFVILRQKQSASSKRKGNPSRHRIFAAAPRDAEP